MLWGRAGRDPNEDALRLFRWRLENKNLIHNQIASDLATQMFESLKAVDFASFYTLDMFISAGYLISDQDHR